MPSYTGPGSLIAHHVGVRVKDWVKQSFPKLGRRSRKPRGTLMTKAEALFVAWEGVVLVSVLGALGLKFFVDIYMSERHRELQRRRELLDHYSQCLHLSSAKIQQIQGSYGFWESARDKSQDRASVAKAKHKISALHADLVELQSQQMQQQQTAIDWVGWVPLAAPLHRWWLRRQWRASQQEAGELRAKSEWFAESASYWGGLHESCLEQLNKLHTQHEEEMQRLFQYSHDLDYWKNYQGRQLLLDASASASWPLTLPPLLLPAAAAAAEWLQGPAAPSAGDGGIGGSAGTEGCSSSTSSSSSSSSGISSNNSGGSIIGGGGAAGGEPGGASGAEGDDPGAALSLSFPALQQLLAPAAEAAERLFSGGSSSEDGHHEQHHTPGGIAVEGAAAAGAGDGSQGHGVVWFPRQGVVSSGGAEAVERPPWWRRHARRWQATAQQTTAQHPEQPEQRQLQQRHPGQQHHPEQPGQQQQQQLQQTPDQQQQQDSGHGRGYTGVRTSSEGDDGSELESGLECRDGGGGVRRRWLLQVRVWLPQWQGYEE